MIVVALELNGRPVELSVAPGDTLLDALRVAGGATEVKRGCGEGVCGTCTVLLDGEPVSSCLVFAVQADGGEVTTVEGIAQLPPGGANGVPPRGIIRTPRGSGELSPVQAAFRENHGLQCGFCTPGFVISVTAFLRDNPDPTDEQIRDALSGNLCRCTGYQGILAAVRAAASSNPPNETR